jgi:hypothetical protein
MGFNFGAFLGGMGTQISENIESEKKFQREKDFRLEMLGEEEATKMRLKKAEEKRLQKIADAKLAGRLKALNFDAPRAAYIMANGEGYAEEMLVLGAQAHANGIDPNTMLKYADGIKEMRQMVGPPGSRVPMFPTDFDYTDAFIQDTDIMTSVRTPQSDAKDTLTKMRAQVIGKMSNLDPIADKDAYDALAAKADFFLKEMVKEAGDIAKEEADARATDETPDKKDILDNRVITSMLNQSTNRVANKYELTSFEGSFENIETGMQGVALVARIDSAILVKESAEDMYNGLKPDVKENIFNNNTPNRMNNEIDATIQDLKQIANLTYQDYLQQNSPEIGTASGLGKKFKGSYNDGRVEVVNAEGVTETVFKTGEQLADEDKSLTYGDVVEINGQLAIYTGFYHTYGNWQEEGTEGFVPKLPFVFEGNDDMYQVTATTRY